MDDKFITDLPPGCYIKERTHNSVTVHFGLPEGVTAGPPVVEQRRPYKVLTREPMPGMTQKKDVLGHFTLTDSGTANICPNVTIKERTPDSVTYHFGPPEGAIFKPLVEQWRPQTVRTRPRMPGMTETKDVFGLY